VLKRNAGLGLAATAFDLQPAVAAVEALCDLGGGLCRPAETSTYSNQNRHRPAASASWGASWARLAAGSCGSSAVPGVFQAAFCQALHAARIRRQERAVGGDLFEYLSGVERSERNVSVDNIARIARGLKVKPYVLLDDSA
jgi:hypothetical protein